MEEGGRGALGGRSRAFHVGVGRFWQGQPRLFLVLSGMEPDVVAPVDG